MMSNDYTTLNDSDWNCVILGDFCYEIPETSAHLHFMISYDSKFRITIPSQNMYYEIIMIHLFLFNTGRYFEIKIVCR